jgi:hypothetical protein
MHCARDRRSRHLQRAGDLPRIVFPGLPGLEVIIPTEVDAESTDADQRRQVDELFARGVVRRDALASLEELTIYAELRVIMGSGQAACIAVAQSRPTSRPTTRRAFLREVKVSHERCLIHRPLSASE